MEKLPPLCSRLFPPSQNPSTFYLHAMARRVGDCIAVYDLEMHLNSNCGKSKNDRHVFVIKNNLIPPRHVCHEFSGSVWKSHWVGKGFRWQNSVTRLRSKGLPPHWNVIIVCTKFSQLSILIGIYECPYIPLVGWKNMLKMGFINPLQSLHSNFHLRKTEKKLLETCNFWK